MGLFQMFWWVYLATHYYYEEFMITTRGPGFFPLLDVFGPSEPIEVGVPDFHIARVIGLHQSESRRRNVFERRT